MKARQAAMIGAIFAFVLWGIALVALPSAAGGEVEDFGKLGIRILSADEVIVVQKAVSELARMPNYNEEQRSIKNYRVWVYPGGEYMEVAFVAISRKGDELASGGNFGYARSCTMQFDRKTLELVRIHGSA